MMIDFTIREMNITDYSQLLDLWKSIDGLCMDEEDSYENMVTFLNRNIGLCYVAVIENKIVGTIKGAQDGRRGYISHMAVLPQFRGIGIAKALYEKTLQELKKQGIWKCNLYVLNTNSAALDFWKHNDWLELEFNFKMLQKNMRTK
jgi:ribosomal protein S18 acetylase RimI-like enzyme